MFNRKNFKFKKLIIYIAIPTALSLGLGFTFRDDIMKSYNNIRKASAEGYQYNCYNTLLDNSANINLCRSSTANDQSIYSFGPNQDNRFQIQTYCKPEGQTQTITPYLFYGTVGTGNGNPNFIVNSVAVQDTANPYPSASIGLSPATQTFNTPASTSNPQGVKVNYNLAATALATSAAQVTQTAPFKVTGSYRDTGVFVGTNTDPVYGLMQSDHSNVAPSVTSPTAPYSSVVPTPSSTDNVPIQFTVTDAEANHTNLTLELSSDNFATILQSHPFAAQAAGTTINYTFTNLPVGSYKWRVSGVETDALGTCNNITGVRYPMTFNLEYGTPNGTPTSTTVLTAPTKGVISGCSISTRTCVYTPNAGITNTVTNDTFVIRNVYNSTTTDYTYTVNFNPLGLPTGNAAVNLNSNQVGNTIVITSSVNADLSVLKKLQSGTLVSGAESAYQLTVTNNGPDTASGPLTLTDTLPSGISFSTNTPAASANNGWACSASGQVVTCTNSGSLANAATSTFVIKINVA